MDQRITLLSMVSGLTSDEQANVRASAARTIGVYILIPVFREVQTESDTEKSGVTVLTRIQDASFVCDAATQLVAAMEDQNLNVRIRVCWSLANLCDSLVSLQYDILFFVPLLSSIFLLICSWWGLIIYTSDSPVIEDIPVTIIVSVCVCCLKATHENDKVSTLSIFFCI